MPQILEGKSGSRWTPSIVKAHHSHPSSPGHREAREQQVSFSKYRFTYFSLRRRSRRCGCVASGKNQAFQRRWASSTSRRRYLLPCGLACCGLRELRSGLCSRLLPSGQNTTGKQFTESPLRKTIPQPRREFHACGKSSQWPRHQIHISGDRACVVSSPLLCSELHIQLCDQLWLIEVGCPAPRKPARDQTSAPALTGLLQRRCATATLDSFEVLAAPLLVAAQLAAQFVRKRGKNKDNVPSICALLLNGL